MGGKREIQIMNIDSYIIIIIIIIIISDWLLDPEGWIDYAKA